MSGTWMSISWSQFILLHRQLSEYLEQGCAALWSRVEPMIRWASSQIPRCWGLVIIDIESWNLTSLIPWAESNTFNSLVSAWCVLYVMCKQCAGGFSGASSMAEHLMWSTALRPTPMSQGSSFSFVELLLLLLQQGSSEGLSMMSDKLQVE